MNWDRIEGNWKQAKGKVKEQWGKLTVEPSRPNSCTFVGHAAAARGYGQG